MSVVSVALVGFGVVVSVESVALVGFGRSGGVGRRRKAIVGWSGEGRKVMVGWRVIMFVGLWGA